MKAPLFPFSSYISISGTILSNTVERFINHITQMVLMATFLGVIGSSYGQSGDRFEAYKEGDYPATKYQMKLETASFYDFTIRIRQLKRIDQTNSPNDFYCRAWLTINKGDKLIRQIYYRSIEPVGSCGGLFTPDHQPLKDYFIISKLGDYDGRIFILDKEGNFTEKRGGTFSLSKDHRYLFSSYNSDLSGLTIYDLTKKLVLFSDSIEPRLDKWYVKGNKYFAEIQDVETNSINSGKMASFDFKTNKINIVNLEKDLMISENELQVYNDYRSVKDCGCGK